MGVILIVASPHHLCCEFVPLLVEMFTVELLPPNIDGSALYVFQQTEKKVRQAVTLSHNQAGACLQSLTKAVAVYTVSE